MFKKSGLRSRETADQEDIDWLKFVQILMEWCTEMQSGRQVKDSEVLDQLTNAVKIQHHRRDRLNDTCEIHDEDRDGLTKRWNGWKIEKFATSAVTV